MDSSKAEVANFSNAITSKKVPEKRRKKPIEDNEFAVTAIAIVLQPPVLKSNQSSVCEKISVRNRNNSHMQD